MSHQQTDEYAETIKVQRTPTRQEQCEIFTFPTDTDRQAFIKDLLKFDPELPHATNMDPDIDEPERFLVAIPVRFYDWVKNEGSQIQDLYEKITKRRGQL